MENRGICHAEDRHGLWHWLLRTTVLPLGDRLTGQGMMQRLAFLQEAQWWPRERLVAYRDDRLRGLLATAYNEVPLYRELMQDAGVEPRDINGAGDLVRLPIVTKDMLRPAYPERTTRRAEGRYWDACSSGSTGHNFCVRQDMPTAGRIRALAVLAFGWAGWWVGCRHLQTGMTLRRGPLKGLKDRLLRCSYESAFDLRNEHLDAMLDLMQRRRIDHIMGYAGSLHLLARRALDRGFDWRLCSVISWGDNLYAHYRSTIEQAFACRVFDTYGCAEGIQVAAQCGYEQHYHLFSTDVIAEILDDDGVPVQAGETGHVVLTRLHPGPMPLIRYRVGDLARAAGDAQCPCGRGFELLGSVQGRDTDVVLTPSGNRLIVHYFTGILEHFREIESFQVVQDEIESIRLRIVPTSWYGGETGERIIAALAEKGAGDLRVDLELVDEIPLPPSQKRRFVISNIAPLPGGSADRA